MRSLAREHGAEALIGLLVVLVAIWFGWYAFQRTGGGRVANAIRVNALFPNASGINTGTDVRVAGIKIGQVAAVKLDPKSFKADVTLAIDPGVASNVGWELSFAAVLGIVLLASPIREWLLARVEGGSDLLLGVAVCPGRRLQPVGDSLQIVDVGLAGVD